MKEVFEDELLTEKILSKAAAFGELTTAIAQVRNAARERIREMKKTTPLSEQAAAIGAIFQEETDRVLKDFVPDPATREVLQEKGVGAAKRFAREEDAFDSFKEGARARSLVLEENSDPKGMSNAIPHSIAGVPLWDKGALAFTDDPLSNVPAVERWFGTTTAERTTAITMNRAGFEIIKAVRAGENLTPEDRGKKWAFAAGLSGGIGINDVLDGKVTIRHMVTDTRMLAGDKFERDPLLATPGRLKEMAELLPGATVTARKNADGDLRVFVEQVVPLDPDTTHRTASVILRNEAEDKILRDLPPVTQIQFLTARGHVNVSEADLETLVPRFIQRQKTLRKTVRFTKD